MSDELPVADTPAEAPPPAVETQPRPNPQQDTQTQAARRRLRELLAIPERDRSDAVWDEIIDIEIDLAQGNNRLPSLGAGPRDHGQPRQQNGRHQQHMRHGQGQPPGKQNKRFFQKRNKQRRPGGGGQNQPR